VVEYICPRCKDEGYVHGWQGTVFDLSSYLDSEATGNRGFCIPIETYPDLCRIEGLSDEARAVLASGVYYGDEIVLSGQPDQLRDLAMAVARGVEQMPGPQRRATLYAALERMAAPVGPAAVDLEDVPLTPPRLDATPEDTGSEPDEPMAAAGEAAPLSAAPAEHAATGSRPIGQAGPRPHDEHREPVGDAPQLPDMEHPGSTPADVSLGYAWPLPRALQRWAVIVHPKQPFLDWVAETCGGDREEYEHVYEARIYLLKNCKSIAQAERRLRKEYLRILEAEIATCAFDPTPWPQDRTFKMFRDWFQYEFCTYVVDLADGSLVSDEG
jgi:hypothetical protein